MKIAQTRKLHAAGILPQPAATDNVEALRERLDALRLVFASEGLDDLLSQSVKEDWSTAVFLDVLLRLELERQEERRVAQDIRISHLPTGPTISNFDFAFQPSVSRSQIETLATGQWIRDGQGLLLQGPPGVGKTHLAVALGLRGIETGFSVSFYRLDELMHQLKGCRAEAGQAQVPEVHGGESGNHRRVRLSATRSRGIESVFSCGELSVRQGFVDSHHDQQGNCQLAVGAGG